MDFIERNKNEEDINLLSPLTWAYVGDSVYELFIRCHLVDISKLKPHKLHVESITYVKAKAQADILKKISNELSEDEMEIVRRTRNTQNHHLPKNADPEDYMYATAFEGLIGYLFLSKKDERLNELLKKCI